MAHCGNNLRISHGVRQGRVWMRERMSAASELSLTKDDRASWNGRVVRIWRWMSMREMAKESMDEGRRKWVLWG